MRLVFGRDQAVAKWVADRIPFVRERGFGPCKAIGVIASDGRELAGIVYHDWNPDFRTIAFSIAAVSPAWARRGIIRGLFHYPFIDCGVLKLWTATPHRNLRALKALKGLGFTQEAILVRQFGKDNAVINRMWASDYQRLYAVKE